MQCVSARVEGSQQRLKFGVHLRPTDPSTHRHISKHLLDYLVLARLHGAHGSPEAYSSRGRRANTLLSPLVFLRRNPSPTPNYVDHEMTWRFAAGLQGPGIAIAFGHRCAFASWRAMRHRTPLLIHTHSPQVAVQPVCDCTSRCDWPRCWISRHFAVIPAGYVHVAPG